MRVKGSFALVTGASSGIGQATAIGLSWAGARMIACLARNPEGLRKTQSACSYDTILRQGAWSAHSIPRMSRMPSSAPSNANRRRSSCRECSGRSLCFTGSSPVRSSIWSAGPAGSIRNAGAQAMPGRLSLSRPGDLTAPLGSSVTRLGLATASRPRRLARHRSGVQVPNSAPHGALFLWSRPGDLNPEPFAYDANALPLS